jgi:glycerophosphoryl diester phosphodiesterase
VPTLEEVLDFIDRRVPVDIELKGPRSAAAVATIVKAYLQHGWQPSDFLISSFNHHELQTFKSLMPAIDVAALMDAVPLDYAAFAQELQAVAVCPGHEFIDKAYVEDAHQRGLQVYVWTVNDPEEVERMCTLGVDGIFTNFPDVARKAVESFQVHTVQR